MQPYTLFELKQCIVELADVLAAAVVRQQDPVRDEMTTRGAYERFGRRWVDRQVRAGRLHCHRVGPHKQSPVVFSFTELLALKRAEEQMRGEILTPKNTRKNL